MMKRNNEYYYSGISSLEDIRLEKARLILKSRLIESRINLDLIQIREEFAFSTMALTLVKDLILPKIADILGTLSSKVENGINPDLNSDL